MRHTVLLTLAIATLAAASFTGCGSITIRITSAPEKAEVYAVPASGEAPKLVGETPLALKGTDLVPTLGGSGPVFLEIRKKGFATVSPVITDLSSQDLNLAFQMRVATESEELTNEAIDLLFSAQSLARQGRLDDALEKLKQVEKKSPSLAATYELMGSVYYIQKKYALALTAYDTALEKHPGNPEVQKLISILESTLGIKRVPAKVNAPQPATEPAAPPADAAATAPADAAPATGGARQ